MELPPTDAALLRIADPDEARLAAFAAVAMSAAAAVPAGDLPLLAVLPRHRGEQNNQIRVFSGFPPRQSIAALADEMRSLVCNLAAVYAVVIIDGVGIALDEEDPRLGLIESGVLHAGTVPLARRMRLVYAESSAGLALLGAYIPHPNGTWRREQPSPEGLALWANPFAPLYPRHDGPLH